MDAVLIPEILGSQRRLRRCWLIEMMSLVNCHVQKVLRSVPSPSRSSILMRRFQQQSRVREDADSHLCIIPCLFSESPCAKLVPVRSAAVWTMETSCETGNLVLGENPKKGWRKGGSGCLFAEASSMWARQQRLPRETGSVGIYPMSVQQFVVRDDSGLLWSVSTR
jgi:hypothetical protein